MIDEAQTGPRSFSAQPEYTVSWHRRNRGLRRRIVDLAKEETSTSVSANETGEQEPGTLDLSQSVVEDSAATRTPESSLGRVHFAGPSDLQQSLDPHTSLRHDEAMRSSPRELEQDDSSDDYRRKVDALKGEFGTNWISMLSEQGWIATRDSVERGNAALISPSPMIVRSSSHAITSGGQTMG